MEVVGVNNETDFVEGSRQAALEIKAQIRVNGGPGDRLQRNLYNLADILGVSEEEFQLKVKRITPKLIKF